MKKTLLYFVCTLIAGVICAHNTIYSIDGSKVTTTIIERKGISIKLPAGITNTPLQLQTKTVEPGAQISGRNLISWVISDLLFNQFSFYYERTSKNRLAAFRVPLTYGMVPLGLSDTFPNSRFRGHYSENKLFSTGIHLVFYTKPEGRFRSFAGMIFEYGQTLVPTTYWNANYPYTGLIYTAWNSSHYSILIQTGVLCQFIKQLHLTINTGVGFVRHQSNEAVNYFDRMDSDNLALRLNISMGYSF